MVIFGENLSFIMPTKLLILGVGGFIGSSMTAKVLFETDWEIYGMDISDCKVKQHLNNTRFHFVKGNIMQNVGWVEEQIQICDVIFPLVAVANPALYVTDPLFVYQRLILRRIWMLSSFA